MPQIIYPKYKNPIQLILIVLEIYTVLNIRILSNLYF